MHCVYVLYSPQFNKIYIGYTQKLQGRVKAHNHPNNKGWTKKYQPWELAYYETFQCQSQALKREKALKSHKGRQGLWQLISDQTE